jgi:adenylate cyclase
MSENTSKDLTILFADVVGSVDLYTQLGDMQAHQRISLFLQSMAIQVEHNHGRVVETIGDEIMCMFNTANDALATACAIQESLKADQEWGLRVRIGFHSGLTGMKDDHPFGDTVNVAARVVALAAAGQIMLTDDVCQRLSEANKASTNHFSDVYIKGKEQPYTIHQALWDQEQGTIMVRNHAKIPVEHRRQHSCFLLRHLDTEVRIPEGKEVLLGRGEQCGLRVNSEAASRIHAILKCRGGRLVLADRSTNGTFVKTRAGKRAADNSELFLHHDEWVTTSDGVVSLGRPLSSQDVVLIHFNGD